MNALFVTLLAALAVSASAGIIGHGAIVSGPSGIVTGAGPIGPHGLGLGYAGHGGYGLGHGLGYSGLGYAGHGLGYGHGAAVYAAPIAHSVVAAPALGYGYGLGHGAVYTNGGGVIGLSGHGVAVKGPATVPAVIAGPSGKIVADGLYGVPTHHGW